jgi:hypothetical protein
LISKVWRIANLPFKPPGTLHIDFRLCHTTIYTYSKLFRIGKVESDLCPVCALVPEDLKHMFLDGKDLQQAKCLIVDVIENLFRHAPFSMLIHYNSFNLFYCFFYLHVPVSILYL